MVGLVLRRAGGAGSSPRWPSDSEATESGRLEAVGRLAAVPQGSVEVTVTGKLEVFAVGVAPTSLVGAPRATVKVALVPAVNAGVPLVWVAVRETPAWAIE